MKKNIKKNRSERKARNFAYESGSSSGDNTLRRNVVDFSPNFRAEKKGSDGNPLPFRPPAVAPGIPDFLRAQYKPPSSQTLADGGYNIQTRPSSNLSVARRGFMVGQSGELQSPVVS